MNSALIAAPLAEVAPGTLVGDLVAACVAANIEVVLYCPPLPRDPRDGGPIVQTFTILRNAGDLHEPAAQNAHYIIDLFDNGPQGWREQKQQVLADLSHIPSDAPLLVNCNTLSATDAAAMCEQPQRVLGFAVVPPFAEAQMVELMLPLQGDDALIARAAVFFDLLGKQTLAVQDSPAGVMPRILAMIINEAAYALQEGVATAEDIDTAMCLGANYPRGPLAWADLIGLHIIYATLWGLHRELGDDRYRPCPLLARMVRAGWHGQSSGQGFYAHQMED